MCAFFYFWQDWRLLALNSLLLAVPKLDTESRKKGAAMNNRHTLFVRVRDYYADLVDRLYAAQQAISMTCLAFEDGHWGRRIANALAERSAAGVQVRLMIDELGQLADEPRHILSSYRILNGLRKRGVRVDVFHPRRSGLSFRNRQHCKFCAVDDETAYLGGSNVGDYYTTWSDTNLRIDGSLGDTLHAAYDHLLSFSLIKNPHPSSQAMSDLWLGDDHLLLNIPGVRLDIRGALLDLISKAQESIHLRTWYFLPDEEILAALCRQAENGVQVNVLLSHRTRVRPVDLANSIHTRRLTCAGGRVYRYTSTYMHAKTAWNDRGTILLGSANLDPHSMGINFESCIQAQDQNLAWQLQQAFESDLSSSTLQTTDTYRRQSFSSQILSHACNLASAWM
jgi:cardiolipin synthase